MKRILAILAILGIFAVLPSILLTSCDNRLQNYHGIEYRSSSEIVTLPLVAFEDNSSTSSSGCFVLCVGSYQSKQVTKYRILVEFPDKTVKVIEFRPSHLFIRYSDKCSITSSLYGFHYNSWYDEVIIEVPRDKVKYENILDGK